MKFDNAFIKEKIDESFKKGYLMIKDQRNNRIILNDGAFLVNGVKQPKSIESITSILLEAFKLSREIQIGEDIYTRSISKWIKKLKSK